MTENLLDVATVDNLNKLTTTQAALVLLRALHTSDLAWMHNLLDERSIRNIAHVCEGILKIEVGDNCHQLTDEQLAEFKELLTFK